MVRPRRGLVGWFARPGAWSRGRRKRFFYPERPREFFRWWRRQVFCPERPGGFFRWRRRQVFCPGRPGVFRVFCCGARPRWRRARVFFCVFPGPGGTPAGRSGGRWCGRCGRVGWCARPQGSGTGWRRRLVWLWVRFGWLQPRWLGWRACNRCARRTLRRRPAPRVILALAWRRRGRVAWLAPRVILVLVWRRWLGSAGQRPRPCFSGRSSSPGSCRCGRPAG